MDARMDYGQRCSAWMSSMGSGFESIRNGVKEISVRWLKASKALKKEDQVYGQKVAEMEKKHSRVGVLRAERFLGGCCVLGAVGTG